MSAIKTYMDAYVNANIYAHTRYKNIRIRIYIYFTDIIKTVLNVI